MGKLVKFSILIWAFLTILCGLLQNDSNLVAARKIRKGSTRTVYMLRHPKMKTLLPAHGKHNNGDGKFSGENLLHHHHEKLHHHHNEEKIGHKKKHHGQILPTHKDNVDHSIPSHPKHQHRIHNSN